MNFYPSLATFFLTLYICESGVFVEELNVEVYASLFSCHLYPPSGSVIRLSSISSLDLTTTKNRPKSIIQLQQTRLRHLRPTHPRDIPIANRIFRQDDIVAALCASASSRTTGHLSQHTNISKQLRSKMRDRRKTVYSSSCLSAPNSLT